MPVSSDTLTVSDVQVPSLLYANTVFDVSFFVQAQNGSGAVQAVLNWNNSDYLFNRLTTTIPKIFWVDQGAAIPNIYVADVNPNTQTPPFNIGSIPVSFPDGSFPPIQGISIDSTNNIVYVAAPQVLYFGSINIYDTNTTVVLQILSQDFISGSNTSTGLFWDELTQQLCVSTYNSTISTKTLYRGTVINNSYTTVSQNILPPPNVANLQIDGVFVDSSNDSVYFADYLQQSITTAIFVRTGTSAPKVIVSASSQDSVIQSFSVDMADATIYWIVSLQIEDGSLPQLWKGTIDNLANPTTVLNQVMVGQGQAGFGNTLQPVGLCMVIPPIRQRFSLLAPAVGSDYPLTITVYDPVSPSVSDIKTTIVPVVQPHITAAVYPNPTSINDPYLIQWTASLTNGTPSDNLVVTLSVPNSDAIFSDCLNGVTYSDVFKAPDAISDFVITATAVYTNQSISCSDVFSFLLGTRKVAVDAGSDRTINYGAGTTLGAGFEDPDIVYTWSPSDGLSATNILSPIAIPLSDTIYTVTATRTFRSDIVKSRSDSVTVFVVSPTQSDTDVAIYTGNDGMRDISYFPALVLMSLVCYCGVLSLLIFFVIGL